MMAWAALQPRLQPGKLISMFISRQGRLDEASRSYRLALEARQGLSAEFIAWLTRKLAECRRGIEHKPMPPDPKSS
jgi:hypothetical protein